MSNDLISRETLKNYARKVMYEQNATNFSLLRMFDEIIDNTPSAPLPDFKEGYKQAIVDGKTNFPRPQGEWTNTSPYDIKGKCSLCCYLSNKCYNFCPNCGADMRKGDTDCMDEDAKQASIPYTYNAPQHDWKCGYPDITRGKGDTE